MKKYQLFSGESKESASGIGGIILTDDMSLAIPSPQFDENRKQNKKYFVNLENLKGKLTQIVEFHEESVDPFGLPIPPYVYRIRLENS